MNISELRDLKLTMEEWDHILARTAEKTSRYEKIFSNHDDIVEYLKSKDQTWLANVEQIDSVLQYQMAGRTARPLQLSRFEDVEGDIERRYLNVPTFEGQIAITV